MLPLQVLTLQFEHRRFCPPRTMALVIRMVPEPPPDVANADIYICMHIAICNSLLADAMWYAAPTDRAVRRGAWWSLEEARAPI